MLISLIYVVYMKEEADKTVGNFLQPYLQVVRMQRQVTVLKDCQLEDLKVFINGIN